MWRSGGARVGLGHTGARAPGSYRLAREACLRHLGELEHVGWVELRRCVKPRGDRHGPGGRRHRRGARLLPGSGCLPRRPHAGSRPGTRGPAVDRAIEADPAALPGISSPPPREDSCSFAPISLAREPTFLTPADTRSPSVFHTDTWRAMRTVRPL